LISEVISLSYIVYKVLVDLEANIDNRILIRYRISVKQSHQCLLAIGVCLRI